ncbi:MAG: tyrosine-type recombinase/integrase [bacterium]|nr:tyrosine-type recombinase/integrase [bacterium]
MGVKIRQIDGKWYVFINHNGKRKAKCVGDSKKAAMEVKRKIEAKLTLGEFDLLDDKPKMPTFQEYADKWLGQYVAIACKPSTQRVVRGIVRNHLAPFFGTNDLHSITRTQVKTFIAQKHQKYSRRYVSILGRTLHTIFSHAVEEELVDANPATRLGKYLPIKQFNSEQKINSFTSEELAHYLATMRTNYPQHYVYFLCLARTGMREGEALGLFWDDIQFGKDTDDAHRFIHVQRTYDAAHQIFNTPKTGRSRRVDMSQELRVALLDLRDRRFDEAVLRGTTAIPKVVFHGRQGRPSAPSGLYVIHKRVCECAGLRANRVHDLRHSYATIQLYEHNTPMQYVSEQLGHSSIKITVDTYGHPRQGTNIALADRLDCQGENVRLNATLAQPSPFIFDL